MSRERPIPELEGRGNDVRSRKDSSDTREGLLFLAGLAAASNRYDHMFEYMKRLVGIVAPSNALTNHERPFFSIACTFLIHGQLKSFHRAAKAASDSSGIDQRRTNAAVNYLQMIASEICKTCSDVVAMIDLCILPAGSSPDSAASAESRVFYKRMKGDFLMYMSEVKKKGADREKVRRGAFEAYLSAQCDEVALPATHPTRLEFRLNLALYCNGTPALRSIAYSTASEAVDQATRALEETGQTATEETAMLLRYLRNCMEIWKTNS